MNFKKKVNGSWTDTPHYIHNTSADTITTLPAVLYPNDTTATVGLKGNTLQSSVPSPTSPVMPQGTGERTGNLWDEEYAEISGGMEYKPIFVGDGTFTMSTSCPVVEGAASLFLLAGNVQSGASTVSNGVYKDRPITVTSISGYVTIAYRRVSYQSRTADPRNEQTMLNTGSTPLPYEPYGYKIPILSANTTTPVYLGEVQTTRRVNKLVLDGTENWQIRQDNTNILYLVLNGMEAYTPCIASHYVYKNRSTGSAMLDGEIATGLGAGIAIWIKDATYTSTADFKTYLAAQYANGTPVTIWYVLATEETAVVNEPLMKIGDYADEVSGISIPVTAGGDTLSVGTTVQPSEVTVNYKGWHPVADVHERDNGAWT